MLFCWAGTQTGRGEGSTCGEQRSGGGSGGEEARTGVLGGGRDTVVGTVLPAGGKSWACGHLAPGNQPGRVGRSRRQGGGRRKQVRPRVLSGLAIPTRCQEGVPFDASATAAGTWAGPPCTGQGHITPSVHTGKASEHTAPAELCWIFPLPGCGGWGGCSHPHWGVTEM